jgi:mRNA-degrading endonuclease toxin of MazEF toxin-antitoxin module
VISNSASNVLDNDLLILPITSKIRGQAFEIVLSEENVSSPLPAVSVVQCDKLHTIRKTRISGIIATVNSITLSDVIEGVCRAICLENVNDKG